MMYLYIFITGACAGILAGMALQREKDNARERAAYERGKREERIARFGDSAKYRAQVDELRAANDYLRTRNWNRRCAEIAIERN